MQAIDRLKEKIEAIKNSYQAAQSEIGRLKTELVETSGNTEEVDTLKSQLLSKEEQIQQLKHEIIEKDTEIEAIIAKVETLLS